MTDAIDLAGTDPDVLRIVLLQRAVAKLDDVPTEDIEAEAMRRALASMERDREFNRKIRENTASTLAAMARPRRWWQR